MSYISEDNSFESYESYVSTDSPSEASSSDNYSPGEDFECPETTNRRTSRRRRSLTPAAIASTTSPKSTTSAPRKMTKKAGNSSASNPISSREDSETKRGTKLRPAASPTTSTRILSSAASSRSIRPTIISTKNKSEKAENSRASNPIFESIPTKPRYRNIDYSLSQDSETATASPTYLRPRTISPGKKSKNAGLGSASNPISARGRTTSGDDKTETASGIRTSRPAASPTYLRPRTISPGRKSENAGLSSASKPISLRGRTTNGDDKNSPSQDSETASRIRTSRPAASPTYLRPRTISPGRKSENAGLSSASKPISLRGRTTNGDDKNSPSPTNLRPRTISPGKKSENAGLSSASKPISLRGRTTSGDDKNSPSQDSETASRQRTSRPAASPTNLRLRTISPGKKSENAGLSSASKPISLRGRTTSGDDNNSPSQDSETASRIRTSRPAASPTNLRPRTISPGKKSDNAGLCSASKPFSSRGRTTSGDDNKPPSQDYETPKRRILRLAASLPLTPRTIFPGKKSENAGLGRASNPSSSGERTTSGDDNNSPSQDSETPKRRILRLAARPPIMPRTISPGEMSKDAEKGSASSLNSSRISTRGRTSGDDKYSPCEGSERTLSSAASQRSLGPTTIYPRKMSEKAENSRASNPIFDKIPTKARSSRRYSPRKKTETASRIRTSRPAASPISLGSRNFSPRESKNAGIGIASDPIFSTFPTKVRTGAYTRSKDDAGKVGGSSGKNGKGSSRNPAQSIAPNNPAQSVAPNNTRNMNLPLKKRNFGDWTPP